MDTLETYHLARGLGFGGVLGSDGGGDVCARDGLRRCKEEADKQGSLVSGVRRVPLEARGLSGLGRLRRLGRIGPQWPTSYFFCKSIFPFQF
jgi:hypothetical protein